MRADVRDDSLTSPSPRERRTGPRLLPVVVGFALAAGAGLLYEGLRGRPAGPAGRPRPVAPRGDLADFEKATISVFEAAAPSVVHVTSPELRVRVGPWRVARVPEGTGTGFVWDEQGHVVTNYHVVRGRERVLIRTHDLREYEARVVDADPTVDLAVLRLVSPPADLVPIPLGTSRDLRVGQAVFAIGNPFGLDYTLTTGVVSALDRVIQSVARTPIRGVIQTDADINPGNSGGPLLDSAGRLVGVNTAIYSPSGVSAGIGFAVPVDTVNRVVPRLLAGERGERPALGVRTTTVRLRGGARHPMITEVLEGGGAAHAGLRAAGDGRYGDVILALDGEVVNQVADLHALLDRRAVGEEVVVRVLRDVGVGNEVLEVPVRLGARRDREP